jgi:hypothetical protein
MLTNFRTGKPMEDTWNTWIKIEKLQRVLEKRVTICQLDSTDGGQGQIEGLWLYGNMVTDLR